MRSRLRSCESEFTGLRRGLVIWITLSVLIIASPAIAGEPVPFFSAAEFRTLAEELSPKVNLFDAVWSKDPDAKFYGGTSRDYLYWLKGQFRNAHSLQEARAIARELRERKSIDIREFIIGESDVDVISQGRVNIEPRQFGVRRIDVQGPALLDPRSPEGINELRQGHIPAEKIVLSRKGIVDRPQFGDGLMEIHQGRLSVRFTEPEVFAKSHYAQQKLNHPVLLAIRYLRLQAMDYFRSHGKGYPDRKQLFSMDRASADAVRKVIRSASDGKELVPYLKQDAFKKWLNGSLQKAFLSYTNPTAAMELMNEFEVPKLISRYDGIEPVNQYLFARPRDPARIGENLHRFGVDSKAFFRDPGPEFPDGYLYHGTKSDESFRAILFQGILPSKSGSAGEGLYGVNQGNRSFAENWAGASPMNLVRFKVQSDARIVDVTQGEGQRILMRFGNDLDAFCDAFGIDILAYPYSTRAYVVKNSASLDRPEGVHRELLSFSAALEKITNARDLPSLVRIVELSHEGFSSTEQDLVADALARKVGELADGTDKSIYFKLLNMGFKMQVDFSNLLKSGKLDPDQAAAGEIEDAARGILDNFNRIYDKYSVSQLKADVGDRIFDRALSIWVEEFKPDRSSSDSRMRALRVLQDHALTPAQARRIVETYPAYPWKDAFGNYRGLLKQAELDRLADPVRTAVDLDQLQKAIGDLKDRMPEERKYVVSELEAHGKAELFRKADPARKAFFIEASKMPGLENLIPAPASAASPVGPREKAVILELDQALPRLKVLEAAWTESRDTGAVREAALKWMKNWISAPDRPGRPGKKDALLQKEVAEFLSHRVLSADQLSELQGRVEATLSVPGDPVPRARSAMKWLGLTGIGKHALPDRKMSKFIIEYPDELRPLLTSWFKEDDFWAPHLSDFRFQLIGEFENHEMNDELHELIRAFVAREGVPSTERELLMGRLAYDPELERQISARLEKSGVRSSHVLDFLKVDRPAEDIGEAKGRLLERVLTRAGDLPPSELSKFLLEVEAQVPESFLEKDREKIRHFGTPPGCQETYQRIFRDSGSSAGI